jgi:tetratricopeptide (TPR) repeat protein
MPSETLVNPFPGLRPFRTDEDYLFFGREGQSEEILRRLRLNRFLAVVGISGSGKSSLIRAGLLPYVFGGFMAGTSSHWRVALFRPGNNPLGNMAHALSDCAVLGDAGSGEKDAVKNEILLEVTLRRSGLGLVEAVRLARLPENENLLIVVDQFEELFRYGHAGSVVRQQDDAAAFVKLLFEATQQSALPIYIVITMRSDFIGDCARFRDLPEAVTAGLYLIPRMSRDQRRKAIEEPVRVAGGMISRRLINRLLNDGGDDPDQLPSLQHALMRTWIYWQERGREAEQIDLDDYLAVGGISEALSRHAEEAFADLPNERSRAIAKRLFQSLTEKGPDNREVRRPTKLGDIAAMADAALPEVIAVIDSFRGEGRSFLTPPPDVSLDDESVIDISHESLIRGWARLRTWVEEEYESAKTYRRLAETAVLHAEAKAGLWNDPDLANALRWRENEKPTAAWAKFYHAAFTPAMAFLEESRLARDEGIAERERNRRRKLRNARLFAAAVLILFLLAAGFAIDAARKTKEANENARKAETALAIATEQKSIAMRKQKEADDARTQANANQDMALGFASSTVRGFSDLSDFTLSLNEVHDKFEALLKEAAKVHDDVLFKDKNNFSASIMRVNALSAMVRLHRVTGRASMAESECAKEEAEAAKLAKAGDNESQRILGAYMLAALGVTRMNLGDKDRALADARRAIAVAGAINLAQNTKDDAAYQQMLRSLSIAYSNSASVEAQYGDRKAALKHNNDAIEVLTGGGDESALATGRSLDDRSRTILISDMENLGAWQVKGKLTDAAMGTYSKAIQLAGKWVDGNLNDQSLMDKLVWLYVDRGDAELSLKQYQKARDDFGRAKGVAERKMDRDSNDGQYDIAVGVGRLGSLAHNQADAEKDTGLKQKDLLSALELHKRALTTFQRMEEKRGKNPLIENNIGNEQHNLAWDSTALQRPVDAKQFYEDCRSSYELAAAVDQRDDYVSAAAGANRSIAIIEEQSGEWKAAASDYERALRLDRKISRPNADTEDALLQDLAWLGNAQFQNNELEPAQKTLNEGVALGVQLLKTDSHPALAKDLILLYTFRGDVFLQKKAYSEAETEYTSAERILPSLDLANVDGKSQKIRTLERFGTLSRTRADVAAEADKREHLVRSKKSYEDALKLRREIEATGTTAAIERDIAASERTLGSICYRLTDWDGAQKHFVASADAYSQVARLLPAQEATQNLQKAYLLIADIYYLRADYELSQAHYAEADEAFASARAAARRQDLTGKDGSPRAQFEEYIASSLRSNAEKGKNMSRNEELLRRALQADENSLTLRRELALANKTAETEQSVGTAEENIGLDYLDLKDRENAKKYFGLSLRTFQQSKPGKESARDAANAYRNLATLELEVNDRTAARDALSSEIEVLKPLIDDTHATKDDRENLASALGLRSWENSLLGDPWAALADAEQGLFIDSDKKFIQINKADAYLLLGQSETARKIYLAVADKPPNTGATWRKSILEDLEEIKNHPELKVDPTVLASLQSELKK